MNTLIFTRAKHFIKIAVLLALFASTFSFMQQVYADEWNVDFSRRFRDVQNQDLRAPASLETSVVPTTTPVKKSAPEASGTSSQGMFNSLWSVSEPSQEIVILNTAKGFVPSTVRLKQGFTYRFHIVNINAKEKNVSFVMDTLSEQHGTYFAEPTSFNLKAEKDGVHKFACPETSIEGRLIITPNAEVRAPANEGL